MYARGPRNKIDGCLIDLSMACVNIGIDEEPGIQFPNCEDEITLTEIDGTNENELPPLTSLNPPEFCLPIDEEEITAVRIHLKLRLDKNYNR